MQVRRNQKPVCSTGLDEEESNVKAKNCDRGSVGMSSVPRRCNATQPSLSRQPAVQTLSLKVRARKTQEAYLISLSLQYRVSNPNFPTRKPSVADYESETNRKFEIRSAFDSVIGAGSGVYGQQWTATRARGRNRKTKSLCSSVSRILHCQETKTTKDPAKDPKKVFSMLCA